MTGVATRPVAVLYAVAEMCVALLVVGVVLLYTSWLADNVLGKTAVYHVAGGLAVLAWAVGRALAGGPRPAAGGLLPPFGLYLAAAAVAVLVAVNRALAFEGWLYWAQGLSLVVAVADLGRDAARRRRLTILLVALGAVVAAIGLLQAGGMDPLDLPRRFRGMPLSSLGNTNFVAHYLEIVVPLSLALVLWRRGQDRVLTATAAACLILGGVHLLLAGSRGGWLGLAVGLPAMARASGQRWRGWGHRVLLAALVAALLSPVAQFVLASIPVRGATAYDTVTAVAADSWQQVMSTFDETNFSRNMRLLIWRDTVRVIRAHPWLGTGPGHLGLTLPAHRTSTGQRQWRELMGPRDNEPYHAHDEFLETWADTGVVGVAALVWLLAGALRLAVVAARSTSGRDRALALGAVGATTAAVVHAFFSFNLRDPVSASHLWILWGLLAAMRAPCPEGHADRPPPRWRRGALPVAALLLGLAGGRVGLGMLMGDHYYLRSRQHLAAGYGNRAILDLRQAVAWRGYEFRYHHELGRVALRKGRPLEAAQALGRSLELHPHNAAAIRLYAQATAALHQPERAVAYLRHAVDIDPLNAANYVLLADALRATGKPQEAAQVRQQALSLRGDTAQLVELALDHLAARDLASARAVLEQAARTAPRDGVVQGQLGAVLLKAGLAQAAESHLRQAIELDVDHRALWYGDLAQALGAQGRPDAALEAARAAAAVAPGDGRWQRLVRRFEATGSARQTRNTP